MSVTTETFLAAYSEFDEIEQAVIAAEVVKDNAIIGNLPWGDNTIADIAVSLLIAHRLTLRFRIDKDNVLPQNMPGAVTNISSDTSSLSVTADSQSKSDAANYKEDFSRTNYGKELLTIIDAVLPPGEVIFSCPSSFDGGSMNDYSGF